MKIKFYRILLRKSLNKWVFVSHVFTPLIFGVFVYNSPNIFSSTIINYLPDGLWAYSLTIAIQRIWHWKINVFNIFLTLGTEIFFEVFQKKHYVGGTFDFVDIMIYFVSSALALFLIKQLKFQVKTL